MKGQFKKGFRQVRNEIPHLVKVIKLGVDKLQLEWDINENKSNKSESTSRSKKTSTEIKTVK